MNVLVTDGNYKHTLGIIRALGLNGFSVFVLSNRAACLGSFSKFCHKHILVRYEHISDISPDDFLKILKAHGIELIVPVGTASFQYCEANREAFLSLAAMALPPHASFCIALSKEATHESLSQIGIRAPKTFCPGHIDQVQDLSIQDFGGRVVIKGRYETGYSMVHYVDKQSELTKRFNAICKRFQLGADQIPIIQEYISGEGQGFFAAYADGICGPTFQHRRLLEYPPTGGVSLVAESIRSEDLDQVGRKILDHLQWNGVAMVEFKRMSNNELVLMEINPKFWGSLDLAIESGVNFPLAYTKIALGMALPNPYEYTVGLRYVWPFPGYLQLLFRFPRSLFKALRLLASARLHSNLWLKKDLAGSVGIFMSPVVHLFRKLIPR